MNKDYVCAESKNDKSDIKAVNRKVNPAVYVENPFIAKAFVETIQDMQVRHHLRLTDGKQHERTIKVLLQVRQDVEILESGNMASFVRKGQSSVNMLSFSYTLAI